MLGGEAARHGGLPACCSPEGPVPGAWGVPSAWGARAGATLHRLVFAGSLPSWEPGRLGSSPRYLASGIFCTGA